MSKFECWDYDNDEDGDEILVDAHNAQTAAERFAKNRYEDSAGDYGETMRVFVKKLGAPETPALPFTVTIEHCPTFIVRTGH